MSRRLYLGRLPTDAQQADVQKLFDGYGRIVDCRVMTGFGFVEFESSKDAEEIVNNFNGKPFLGQSIIVEFAREGRSRRDDFGRRGDMPPPRVRRSNGFRVSVTGISRDTSWQDLKDFGREAGNVSFADVDRDFPGTGVLEYLTQEDCDGAVKMLDGKELRGVSVRVAADTESGRDRGGDRGGDRERYRSPPPRRSRSPPRRARDDSYRRRSRSPRGPPPRREDDRHDYRSSRNGDARNGDEYRKDDSYRRESRDDRDRGHRDSYRDDREGGSSARY